MKLIVATHNPNKVREFQRILSPFGITAVSQSDAGITVEAVEDAGTFEGNSMKKAKAVFDACALPTVADDSGLEVYALNREPGVYSARYGGAELNDSDRVALLLKNMKDVLQSERGARFVCCITLLLSAEQQYTFTGTCEGKIAFEPHGNDGFGYDPVFLVGEKSFAELSPEEKDAVSHRGNALLQLKKKLNELMQGGNLC